jgi:hypothetical protein
MDDGVLLTFSGLRLDAEPLLQCFQTDALGSQQEFVAASSYVHAKIVQLAQMDIGGDHALFQHAQQMLVLGFPAIMGGTSLSKGWKLAERFSEDIDVVMLCRNHLISGASVNR